MNDYFLFSWKTFNNFKNIFYGLPAVRHLRFFRSCWLRCKLKLRVVADDSSVTIGLDLSVEVSCAGNVRSVKQQQLLLNRRNLNSKL